MSSLHDAAINPRLSFDGSAIDVFAYDADTEPSIAISATFNANCAIIARTTTAPSVTAAVDFRATDSPGHGHPNVYSFADDDRGDIATGSRS